MKHATAESTEPLNDIDDASGRAASDGDLGPPKKRSAAAKATSGVEVRALRDDDDAELVDERDLLDEMGFALEQTSVGRSGGDAKLSPQRPKAPDLLDKGIGSESPALEALARIEDDDERTTPHMVRGDDGLPEVVALLSAPISAPVYAPVARQEAMTVRLPSKPPPRSEEPQEPVPSLAAIANAEPVKHLPPPPRPLPPVPAPPPSLRAHAAEDDVVVAVRERRRRKPVDRPVALPAYTPGAVTIRSPRPSISLKHAKPSSKSGLSWGWAAALVLVGAGAYAAGTAGARDERVATRPAAVTQGDARPSTPAASEAFESTSVEPIAASEPAVAADAIPAVAPPEAPAPSQPTRDAAKAPGPRAAIHASSIGARSFATREPETTPVAAPPPTHGIDASAASSTLARAGAKAVSCTDPRGGEGTVSVTFLPSGNPVNVKMNGPYNGTAVANCVEQLFRATRVAPFEGSATTVYYTVRLPGDGKPIN